MSGIIGTDQNFDAEVIKSTVPVLVDFWAEWCGPCKMLNPIVEELATEYGNKVKIVSVDVDSNQTSSGKYNILSIPTVIIFKGGQPVSQLVGVQPKERYQEEINKLI